MEYEEMQKRLAQCVPEKKDELLLRILKGEKVDITQDSDLFYLINKDRVSIDEFTNRDKFKAAAEDMKRHKQHIYDTHYGKSRNNKLRWYGDIPTEIWFSRPEFSPLLDKKERDNNIRKFFNKFPMFRAGDKQV